MDEFAPVVDAVNGLDASAMRLEELLHRAAAFLGEQVSTRTARLYATEGLMDRPAKEGRRAVYGQRHLLQLLLVRTLARRGLSLSAIAPLVVGSDTELTDQLWLLDDEPQSQSPNRQRDEALAFLQSVRSSPVQFLGSPLSARSPSLRSSRMSGRSASASSRWHRFSLAPGVELHLSESASIPLPGERRDAWLERLFNRLREQLDVE